MYHKLPLQIVKGCIVVMSAGIQHRSKGMDRGRKKAVWATRENRDGKHR